MKAIAATLVLVLSAGAVRAQDAAPAAPSPAAVEPPTCTITTVVVKKGDVVLSSNSTTKCVKPGEKPAEGGAGGGLFGGVAAVPGAVLKPLLNGPSLLASPPDMEMRHMTGVWQTVRGPRKSCQVVLLTQTTPLGRGVRAGSCTGVLGRAKGWKVEDKDVVMVDQAGAVLARLQGDRDRISGVADDGELLVLQR